MLLKGKQQRLKLKQDGTPWQDLAGPVMEYLLDFAPNHYNLPVSKALWHKAEVGTEYDLDLFSEKQPAHHMGLPSTFLLGASE
jgi:hypothetical protein